MKTLFWLGLVVCILHLTTAPPVTQKKPDDETPPEAEGDSVNPEQYVEYHRYLSQVVEALETDAEFRDKLQKAEELEIRSGRIARELDFVNHNVRNKLDELKRQELERLRHLATKQFELQNELDTDHAKVSIQVEHLDHNNPHTFEIEDLKKLIIKTSEDLAEADKKRRTEFKEYEMQKEFEKQQKLQTLDEEHKKEYEKEIHDQEEKHKKHEPLHHPGSRQQLEEVWEKQDHMDSQQFDPKTFFMLHDVDGNGVWDQVEVKALFVKELDKLYNSGLPEDDIRERQEEMERMREHVFRESDTNRDGFISYEEFLTESRREEFDKDEGWKGLDEQQVYTPEEYQEFERKRLEEVHRMVQQGLIPPQPNYQGQQFHPQAGYQQPQFHDQQQYPQQYHPNAIPQNYNPQGHGHPQQGQMYPQQGQMHPQQGQMHPQQGQMHPQQGQMHPQQGQMHPQQGQMHPQQGQMHPQQGQMHPQQGQMHPQQGQMPQQGQIPQQGQVPQQGKVQQPQAQAQQPQVQAQQPQAQAPQAQVQQPQAQVQQPQAQVQQPQVQAQQAQSNEQTQQKPNIPSQQQPNANAQPSQGNAPPVHV